MIPDWQIRERAFEALYAADYQLVAGYVLRRVPHDEADDVIAQVFTVAWRRFEKVPPPPEDRRWLFGVARNSIADQQRAHRRRAHLHLRLSHDAVTANSRADDGDPAGEQVRAAISALRPPDREALHLVLWDGLSHAEAWPRTTSPLPPRAASTGGLSIAANQGGAGLPGYPRDWVTTLDASTTASARTATSQPSNGTVGYVEGNLAGLTARQFRHLPATQQGIAALLRDYYKQTPCGQHPASDCSTGDQVVWDEAVRLLQDPVSAQVKSATFKVMAALPGVKSLGAMTDPLGRRGYALAPGSQEPNLFKHYYNPTKAILPDPGREVPLRRPRLRGTIPAQQHGHLHRRRQRGLDERPAAGAVAARGALHRIPWPAPV